VTSDREQAVDGEKRSEFTSWYLREAPRTVKTLTLAVGDAHLAQEVAAEAYARAWANWKQVSGMAAPSGWVYRVAMNLIRSRARRLRRDRLYARTAATPVVTTFSSPIDASLWKAVADLPPRARVAIAYRYLADLPEAEIATAMGISRGTVASTLSAARRQLAESLDSNSDRQGAVHDG
jgi:RNA polymerase sigma factor (sigma-70 family)